MNLTELSNILPQPHDMWFKHLRDESFDVDAAAELIAEQMEKHSPKSKYSRKDSTDYKTIATKWLVAVPLFLDKNAKLPISNSNLAMKHPFSIQAELDIIQSTIVSEKYNGKKRWVYWLRDNFPLWYLDQKGWEGQMSLITPLYHKVWTLLQTDIEYFKEAYLQEEKELIERGDYDYQLIEINLKSLSNFIDTTVDKIKHYKGKKEDNFYKKLCNDAGDAIKIKKLAEVFNKEVVDDYSSKTYNLVPQPYTIAMSGRTYFTGSFSLQGMSKEVRKAALGDCYEVDLNSAVFGYYRLIADQAGLTLPILDRMLHEKEIVRAELASKLVNMNVSQSFKMKLIKQALTALSFGGRRGVFNPNTQGGVGLASIIRNKSDLENVINSEVYQQIKDAYAQIKDYIKGKYEAELRAAKDELTPEAVEKLFKGNGQINWDSYLAYLYQRYESNVMKTLIDDLNSHHGDNIPRKVLLHVHDGVYVRYKPDMGSLTTLLKEKHNIYATIDKDQIKQYANMVMRTLSKEEEEEHKEFIRKEEEMAKKLKNIGTGVGWVEKVDWEKKNKEYHDKIEMDNLIFRTTGVIVGYENREDDEESTNEDYYVGSYFNEPYSRTKY